MSIEAVAVRGKPLVIGCGREGCQDNHEVYALTDVLILEATIRVGDAQKPLADRNVDKGLMMLVPVGDQHAAVPTLLGMWLETVSLN